MLNNLIQRDREIHWLIVKILGFCCRGWDNAPENTIKQFIKFCTKAKSIRSNCFRDICCRDLSVIFLSRAIKNRWKMNQLSFLSHRVTSSHCSELYYKNCYCRWQKWDNKTNKYRNAVNRAHKSQFSINFISHFWTKTKQFLAADVFMLAAAVHWKMHFRNLSMALCSVLANAVSVFKFSNFRWKF